MDEEARVETGPARAADGAPRDPARMEARRMDAARMFEAGRNQAEVARRLGVSHQAVSRWYRRWARGGRQALVAAPAGRPPKLSSDQRVRVRRALAGAPAHSGIEAEQWDARSCAILIEKVSGVVYHPSQVWRILRQLGWVPPERPGRPRRMAGDGAPGNAGLDVGGG